MEKAIQLDVENIIYTKNKTLHRLMPKFMLNYLRRILHEEDINIILEDSVGVNGVDFAKKIIEDFNVSYTVINEENIPINGNHIIASNHPLGGFDGLILAHVFSKYKDNIKVTVNDLLMNVPNLVDIFVPINKTGKNTTSLAIALNNTFKEDNMIVFFPAGMCSRKTKKDIVDLEWKKTFVSKAKEYQRDVIPIYFEGKNSNFFYNLANFRKKIGLKANIEMIYLPDELFKQKNKHFKIVIGKPIPYQTFTKEKNDYEHAKDIKKIV
ncbi:MAG: glycerol acyltransferase [Bacteroidales bacterium]|nr:glycerol acyltransferase [Bacteroidales bacterium]